MGQLAGFGEKNVLNYQKIQMLERVNHLIGYRRPR